MEIHKIDVQKLRLTPTDAEFRRVLSQYTESKDRRIKALEDLLTAQREYTKFLSDYCSSIAPYLANHRMGASQEEIDKGIMLREKIDIAIKALNP